MQVEHYFCPNTWTVTYIVFDEVSKDAVIIDPVLDFDPLSVKVTEESVGKYLAFIKEKGLKVHYVLDTHAHADHLSAFQPLREALGAKIGIGDQIVAVQGVFKEMFAFGDDFAADGSDFDVLVADGDVLQAGTLTVRAIGTPGHTPACMTYEIGGSLFVGDALFMPDFGTGRCDFPGGSAEAMYHSVQKLYAFPEETRVYVGHDYAPGGRELMCQTTIGESKRSNKQLRGDTTMEEFVTWRAERDAVLRPPKLIFQSLQVNAKAGRLPEADAKGRRMMVLPMGVL